MKYRLHNFRLLTLATCLMLFGCHGDLYPGSDNYPSFINEEQQQLNALADQIESESDILEVWCLPPATIEVKTRPEIEPRSLTGREFDIYNQYCVDLQPKGMEGVVSGEGGTAIVMMTAVDGGGRYLRVDLVRLADETQRRTSCSWLKSLESDAVCDIEARNNWVIRYEWNAENDLATLYD